MSSASQKAFPLDGLKLIKGENVDWNKAIGSQPIVLEFWATWCPPCRQSIPHLTKLQQKYKDKGLIVVGVSNEDESKLLPFVQQMGNDMDYRVACDKGYAITKDYHTNFKIEGIPHAFIIDATGRIAYSGHPMEPKFEQMLIESLGKGGSGFSAGGSSPAGSGKVSPNSGNRDWSKMSRQELCTLPAHDLKNALKEKGVDVSSCVEKLDFVDLIIEKFQGGKHATELGHAGIAKPPSDLHQGAAAGGPAGSSAFAAQPAGAAGGIPTAAPAPG